MVSRESWKLVRSKRGRYFFRWPDGSRIVVVPQPKRDFSLGTLRIIFKQASRDWNGRS